MRTWIIVAVLSIPTTAWAESLEFITGRRTAELLIDACRLRVAANIGGRMRPLGVEVDGVACPTNGVDALPIVVRTSPDPELAGVRVVLAADAPDAKPGELHATLALVRSALDGPIDLPALPAPQADPPKKRQRSEPLVVFGAIVGIGGGLLAVGGLLGLGVCSGGVGPRLGVPTQCDATPFAAAIGAGLGTSALGILAIVVGSQQIDVTPSVTPSSASATFTIRF